MNHNPLPERLRALPAHTPPPGGWHRMDERLNARRRNYVVAGGGFALAASVLVAVGLVGLRPDPAPQAAPAASNTLVASAEPARRAAELSPAVAQLIDRSQALERQLSSARTQVAVWNTGRDNRALFLETELRRVDARLAFAEPKDAEALWDRRVRLMNALVDLHETEAPALQYASYQY